MLVCEKPDQRSRVDVCSLTRDGSEDLTGMRNGLRGIRYRLTILILAVFVVLRGFVSSSVEADWRLDFENDNSLPVILSETESGDESPTFSSNAEGGILTFQDSVSIGNGGTDYVKALVPQPFSDVQVSATLNPLGTTASGALGVVSRSATFPGESYYAGFASWLDGSDRGGLFVGKSYDGGVVRQLNSWEEPNVPESISPFQSPYFIELTVIDKVDEDGRDYTDVAASLIDPVDTSEVMAMSFQDYGSDEPRLTSGYSGLLAGLGGYPPGRSLQATYDNVQAISLSTIELVAGDADMDKDFDQLDLVRVQTAAKYLSSQSATWGEGDWNGAPGGVIGNPPAGDGLFDQLDIVSALAAGAYLTGPYATMNTGIVTGGPFQSDSLAVPIAHSLEEEHGDVSFTSVPIPEPHSIGLVVVGFALIAYGVRFNRCD